MVEYKVFVHVESLDVLPKSGRRRAEVISFIQNLGFVAHLGGDSKRVDDNSGRILEVTEVAGFAISWWIDVPVNEVKIVDIYHC